MIGNVEQPTLESSICEIQKIYHQRGFIIDSVLLDGQFNCVESYLREKQIKSNICSTDEHIGEIERLIRTIKERCRGIYNTISFDKLPGRMVAELV